MGCPVLCSAPVNQVRLSRALQEQSSSPDFLYGRLVMKL